MVRWMEPVLDTVLMVNVLADVFLTVLYARAGTGIMSDHLARQVWLTQTIPSLIVSRWCFVGETTANVERSFITGIAFLTPFAVSNGSDDTAVVRFGGTSGRDAPASAKAAFGAGPSLL